MNIEEQSNIISNGSALYTIIEHLLDVIDDSDLSLFANSGEFVKSFLQPILDDARSKLDKDIFEAYERLVNAVKP